MPGGKRQANGGKSKILLLLVPTSSATLSCKGLGELVIDTSPPPLAGGAGLARTARARRELMGKGLRSGV